MAFFFPFPSHSHRIIPIPIPTHSHSHFRQQLYYREICILCLKFKTKCEVRAYSRSIVNQTHHSSVIIIITITAYHCSLFNVYPTVTACYCAKTAGCSHCRWEVYFSPTKYAISIPIPIPNQQPKTIPIPTGIPRESHGNGNCHSHAHLQSLVASLSVQVDPEVQFREAHGSGERRQQRNGNVMSVLEGSVLEQSKAPSDFTRRDNIGLGPTTR